jgi:hypothetical protein
VAPTSVNAAAPTAVRLASSLETCLILLIPPDDYLS